MLPPYEASSLVATLIRRCTTITSLEKAHQLHARILTAIGSRTPYLSNNILSMYARCASYGDARKVFDGMPQRNTVSYNAIITAYSRSRGNAPLALELVSQMDLEGVPLNGSTFASLVQASALLEDRSVGSLIHTRSLKTGFLSDICVQTSILGMYSSCGDLESANKMFRYLTIRDDVAWNSVIYGNLRNEKIGEGLRLFTDMLNSGVNPTQFTYSMLLNASSRFENYHFGLMIHAQMIVSNTVADLPLKNALLDMYCNCQDMERAFYVFDRIEKPDLVSWNTIITGCQENGCGDKSRDLFMQLKKTSSPKPDEYTFAAVISAAPASGESFHALVTKSGIESNVFVGTTLVSMYFRNGKVEAARKLFASIPAKDAVLWTEMIVGEYRTGNAEYSVKSLLEMYRELKKTDSFALSGAVAACSDLASLKQGEMIHALAIKTGYDAAMSVAGSLVDMYGKSGDLVSARSVFALVSNPDMECWNSMLGAYGHHGMAEHAWNIFERMLEHGLKPDQVTYLTLLSACSHSGCTEKGKFLWNHMKEIDLKPGPKHYSCMVSLLSRAGCFEEAEEIINESENRDGHLELWRTVLSACVTSKNLRTGVHAAEEALRLEPNDSATHILLSNLYAVAGNWNNMAEMRKKIKRLELAKDPGFSWIEINNSIQVFSSGDRFFPGAAKAL